jgi:CubicO group peptidase (beta-lactamase class C family)
MILGLGARSGVRLLSERSVEEMATDQLSDMVVTEQPGVLPSLSRAFPLGAGRDGFGLGFQISRGESIGRSPGSLSWAGLRNTHFWIDIERGIGVVLLVQMLPFYEERVIQFLSDFEPSLYANLSHD